MYAIYVGRYPEMVRTKFSAIARARYLRSFYGRRRVFVLPPCNPER